MAAQTPVAPEDYLKTSFEGPDCEYVEGELLERGMPTYLHGKIQALLCILFGTLIKRYPVFIVTEVRHAVHPRHLYRIPDVAVFAGQQPTQPVPDTPPARRHRDRLARRPPLRNPQKIRRIPPLGRRAHLAD